MCSTRRDFIKSVGIAIASLVMTRCIPFGGDDSPRGRLRNCWLRLDWLAQQARGDYERGDRAREELAATHRAALDDLIAADELDADVADELGHLAVARMFAPVPFDPPVGEVDTEGRGAAVHRRADVLGAGPVLGVNDPLTRAGIPILEIEVVRVSKRHQVGCVAALIAAGVNAAEINERVEFLDGRQSPVVVAGQAERFGTGDRFGPRHLSAVGLLPHQPGVQVGDRAVAVVHVAGLIPRVCASWP